MFKASVLFYVFLQILPKKVMFPQNNIINKIYDTQEMQLRYESSNRTVLIQPKLNPLTLKEKFKGL